MSVQDTTEQLWGGETTKAVANFPVSGEPVPVAVVRQLGRIKGAAARVNAGQATMERGGAFLVDVTPRPGHSLTELETAIDSVLARLRADGPTAEEMARTRAGLAFRFVAGLESNLGKAETLNAGAVFHDDPAYFRTQYARLQGVTAADVRRVANGQQPGVLNPCPHLGELHRVVDVAAPPPGYLVGSAHRCSFAAGAVSYSSQN